MSSFLTYSSLILSISGAITGVIITIWAYRTRSKSDHMVRLIITKEGPLARTPYEEEFGSETSPQDSGDMDLKANERVAETHE